MTATSTGLVGPYVGILAVAVVASVVLGVVDLLRQPGWAWRAAGEPKLLCLMLVALLPGVGLAIYVFGVRPKVHTVASAGRAANLPFERFGDRPTLATESTRSIRALASLTARGSFGEPLPARTIRASGPTVDPAGRGGFFEDPDVVTVGGPSVTMAPDAPAPRAATATEAPTIRIPGSLGRPYHPRQRTSLEEDQSLASVASQILGATGAPDAPSPYAVPMAVPTAQFGAASGGPPPAQAAGRSFTATPPAHASGHRSGARAPSPRATSLQLAAAPVATPGTPEIFRPRPDAVAPLAYGTSTAVATATPRPTMAARWLPDPTGRHQYRYWDGTSWTENIYDAGVESRDPVSS